MKSKTKEIVFLIIALLCLAMFVVLWILVKTGYDFKIDRLNAILYENQNAGVIAFFKEATFLGDWKVLCLIAIVKMLRSRDKKIGLAFVLSTIISILLCLSVKYIVCRPRPENMLIKEIGYSFPSAHSTISFAVWGMFVYSAIKSDLKPWQKAISIIFIVAVILLVGFSRIILNVHFVSDVLAGFLLGFVSIYIAVQLTKLVKPKLENTQETIQV